MPNAFSLEAWQVAAEDVLSPLLIERYTDEGSPYFFKAYYEIGLSVLDMPEGKWRTLYQVVCDLHRDKKPVNWNNVAAANLGIPSDWFHTTATLFDDVRERDFESNMRICMDYGRRWRTVKVLELTAHNIKVGKDLDAEIRNVVDVVSSTNDGGIRGETADESGNDFEQWMQEPPAAVVETGIKWLDAEIGGLSRGMFYALAGAYKSRKSTIGYNIILKAARAGESCAILSLENKRRKIVAIFVAMIAIEYLLEKHGNYGVDNQIYWLGGAQLYIAKAAYRSWRREKVEAIDYAIAEWRKLDERIRIYDMTPAGGELSSLESVRRVIARDKHLYGGWLYMIDHIGLIEPGIDTDYEQLRIVSNALRGMTRSDDEHPISIMALAQLNEEAIKRGSGYSAGVKGGGALSADIDVLMMTRPVEEGNGKFHNDRSEVSVRFNRDGGSTEWNTVIYHPASGLIMPSGTFSLAKMEIVA